MFGLLTTVYLLLIASFVFIYQGYRLSIKYDITQTDVAQAIFWRYQVGIILFAMYWAANMVTHCLFVMQYWIVAKKI